MEDLNPDVEYFLHRTGIELKEEYKDRKLNPTEDHDAKARFAARSHTCP